MLCSQLHCQKALAETLLLSNSLSAGAGLAEAVAEGIRAAEAQVRPCAESQFPHKAVNLGPSSDQQHFECLQNNKRTGGIRAVEAQVRSCATSHPKCVRESFLSTTYWSESTESSR